MAMVSMVHLARFRNKQIAIVAVIFLIFSCSTERKVLLHVTFDDPALSIRNGIVYYQSDFFSGSLYQLYATGDTAVITQYEDGKQHGWEYKWYSNGNIAEERFYREGKKEGVHKGWREDCTKRFEYHFVDDEHEGELIEWFPNGRVARNFNYVAGYEEGMQQMWWDDGNIRANYVVKNGERFGLLGQKLCRNNM